MAGTLFSSFNTLANIYAVNFENLKYVCSARCKQIFKILDVKYKKFFIFIPVWNLYPDLFSSGCCRWC